jgi:hypothetical protein
MMMVVTVMAVALHLFRNYGKTLSGVKYLLPFVRARS